MKHGNEKQAASECKEYFYKMAELTGTLWEHDSIFGSLNHCFASYIANIIIQCVSGFVIADTIEKKIYLKNGVLNCDFNLEIPIDDEVLKIKGCTQKIEITNPKNYEIIVN